MTTLGPLELFETVSFPRQEEVKEEERMEVESEENTVGSAEDVPNTIPDEGPAGVKACTDLTSPDTENGPNSPLTSEEKSQSSSSSSSSLEPSNPCSLQQDADVGGGEGTCTVSVS